MHGAWVQLALWSAVINPAAVQAAVPDPEAIALRWEAPPGCPDEASVRGDVAGMLDEARPDAASFDARISESDGQGMSLQLATHWADGREDERTLEAGSCEELTDAAVLLIAISLDAIATAGTVRDHGWDRRSTAAPEPETETVPEPVPVPAPAPDRKAADPPPPPPPPPPSPLTFGIRPVFVADWGSLPRLAPGAGLDLSVTWKLLRAELAAVYLPPQRATRSDVQKQGAWVELGAVAPRVCVTPTTGAVSFPVCAGIEMGAMRARGIGTVLSVPGHQFWAAATGGPTLIWAFIPRLAMAIGLDIVVPITRPDVVTANLDVLHSPESVALRPHLGLEVRL
jgi:hypothetical protein